jgi:hypothetical protein
MLEEFIKYILGEWRVIALSSPDRPTCENKIVDRFGAQHELELVVPSPPSSPPPPESMDDYGAKPPGM